MKQGSDGHSPARMSSKKVRMDEKDNDRDGERREDCLWWSRPEETKVAEMVGGGARRVG